MGPDLKQEEREKTPPPLYKGQMCKELGQTHWSCPPNRQLLGPHHSLHPAEAKGRPSCLLGWSQHCKAALRESLLSFGISLFSFSGATPLVGPGGVCHKHLMRIRKLSRTKPGSCPGRTNSPLRWTLMKCTLTSVCCLQR